MSNGKGVLFSHEYIGALLVLTGEVSIDELVAVQALMRSTYDQSNTVRGRCCRVECELYWRQGRWQHRRGVDDRPSRSDVP